jgi:hypothetical protein
MACMGVASPGCTLIGPTTEFFLISFVACIWWVCKANSCPTDEVSVLSRDEIVEISSPGTVWLGAMLPIEGRGPPKGEVNPEPFVFAGAKGS